MYDQEFIKTISDFDKNKTANLKGRVQELVVKMTSELYKRIPTQEQETIRQIAEKMSKIKFFVDKKFELDFQNGATKTFAKRNIDVKGDIESIFDRNILDNETKIKLRYKDEKNKVEKEFGVIDSLLDFLLKNNFLSEISIDSIFDKYRIDFWRYIGGMICIIESKNKEKTYLEKRDLNQIVRYGELLRKISNIGHFYLVLNGYTQDWTDELNEIKYHYGIEIRIMKLKNWLIKYSEEFKEKIDFLIYTKVKLNIAGLKIIRGGKKSKYYLYLKISKYDNPGYYKPIELLISDNRDRIEKFIETITPNK